MSKKMEKLIGEIFADKRVGGFGRNMDRAKELRQYGQKALDIILDEIFSRKTKGELCFFEYNSPVYHILRVVEHLAQPRHASRVAEILLWEELLKEEDRSCRVMVSNILKKIGDKSVVPALEAFAEKVKSIEYTDFYYRDFYDNDGDTIPGYEYNKMDQDDIASAIAACKAR
ncbi:MAG: hypothetical protein HYT20_02920 [Candidatus Nealsonbacteria bacterium]|nr:hypothetical protein [Candidatus Nealsonbacteria bacterium]